MAIVNELRGARMRRELGPRKGFIVTFTEVSAVSKLNGEFVRTGIDDYVSCEPVGAEIEDGESAVDIALRSLTDEDVFLVSHSLFRPGAWYSTHFNNAGLQFSYHPANFTVDEEKAIYDRMTRAI